MIANSRSTRRPSRPFPDPRPNGGSAAPTQTYLSDRRHHHHPLLAATWTLSRRFCFTGNRTYSTLRRAPPNPPPRPHPLSKEAKRTVDQLAAAAAPSRIFSHRSARSGAPLLLLLLLLALRQVEVTATRAHRTGRFIAESAKKSTNNYSRVAAATQPGGIFPSHLRRRVAAIAANNQGANFAWSDHRTSQTPQPKAESS